MMDRVGFERLFQSMFRYRLKYADWLRSWVQLPPGPFLPVVQYSIGLSSLMIVVGQIHIKCLESYFIGLLPDKNSFKAIMYIHITAYGKARR
jgi:hypothetical protein